MSLFIIISYISAITICLFCPIYMYLYILYIHGIDISIFLYFYHLPAPTLYCIERQQFVYHVSYMNLYSILFFYSPCPSPGRACGVCMSYFAMPVCLLRTVLRACSPGPATFYLVAPASCPTCYRPGRPYIYLYVFWYTWPGGLVDARRTTAWPHGYLLPGRNRHVRRQFLFPAEEHRISSYSKYVALQTYFYPHVPFLYSCWTCAIVFYLEELLNFYALL